MDLADADIRILGAGASLNLGEHLVVADLDGDGSPELVATEGEGVVLLPWASGTSEDGQVLVATALSVLAGELDGEPGSELVVASSYGGWAWSDGLAWEPILEHEGYLAAVGDVDGDGLDDVLVRPLDGGAAFFDAQGGLLWSHATHAGDAAVGDVDGDGNLDVLIGQGNTATLMRDPLHGALEANWDGFGNCVDIADVDDDGVEDVLVSQAHYVTGGETGAGGVWLGGPGAPEGPMPLDSADIGVQHDVACLGGAGPGLLAASSDYDRSWLWREPTPGWSSTYDAPAVLPWLSSWVVVDVNGGGFEDLVVSDFAHDGGGAGAGLVAVLYGP